MTADLVYVVAGVSLLLAIVLPDLLDRWAISAPMVLVGVGMLIGLTPLPDGLPLDPQTNRAAIEHVTELVVIVALMGVGLALDRPLELRARQSWGRWAPTWRLLAIGMPLTIAAMAAPRLGRRARPRRRAAARGRTGAHRSRARLRRPGRGAADR